jgi:hypothetical protein
MPVEVRFKIAACAIGSTIYVFGGCDNDYDPQASVFAFDTVANTWRTLAPMAAAFSELNACVLEELVYIVGIGASSHGVLCLNPALESWNILSPIDTLLDRQKVTSYVLGGCLYVAGGNITSSFKSVERYDVAANTWTADVADTLEGRFHFGAVTIGSVGSAEEQDLFDSLIAKASRRP